MDNTLYDLQRIQMYHVTHLNVMTTKITTKMTTVVLSEMFDLIRGAANDLSNEIKEFERKQREDHGLYESDESDGEDITLDDLCIKRVEYKPQLQRKCERYARTCIKPIIKYVRKHRCSSDDMVKILRLIFPVFRDDTIAGISDTGKIFWYWVRQGLRKEYEAAVDVIIPQIPPNIDLATCREDLIALYETQEMIVLARSDVSRPETIERLKCLFGDANVDYKFKEDAYMLVIGNKLTPSRRPAAEVLLPLYKKSQLYSYGPSRDDVEKFCAECERDIKDLRIREHYAMTVITEFASRPGHLLYNRAQTRFETNKRQKI